jgi:hypothetical protein
MGLSSISLQKDRLWSYRLSPGHPDDDETGDIGRSDRRNAPQEELPYKVELWDATKNTVEQVLAVTARGSIGYAAYYAAVREYPDRYVTLRHKNGIIARSNGPAH